VIGDTPEWTLWALVGLLLFVMLLPAGRFQDKLVHGGSFMCGYPGNAREAISASL
jgi:hypothetical protein